MFTLILALIVSICDGCCEYCNSLKISNKNNNSNLNGKYTIKHNYKTWNPVFFKNDGSKRLRCLNFRNGTCHNRIDSIESIYPYFTSNVDQVWVIHINDSFRKEVYLEITCLSDNEVSSSILAILLLIIIIICVAILLSINERQRLGNRNRNYTTIELASSQ